jgi:hypothetical protein
MFAKFDIQKERKYQFAIKRPNGYYDDQDGDYSSRFITEGQPQLWVIHECRPTSTAQ